MNDLMNKLQILGSQKDRDESDWALKAQEHEKVTLNKKDYSRPHGTA